MTNNPYQPPQTDAPAPPPHVSHQKMPPGPGVCPACGVSDYTPVKYTWWGGLLGPKLFNHAKCNGCQSTFNSKTGKSNDRAITVYFIVLAVVGLGVGVAVALR